MSCSDVLDFLALVGIIAGVSLGGVYLVSKVSKKPEKNVAAQVQMCEQESKGNIMLTLNRDVSYEVPVIQSNANVRFDNSRLTNIVAQSDSSVTNTAQNVSTNKTASGNTVKKLSSGYTINHMINLDEIVSVKGMIKDIHYPSVPYKFNQENSCLVPYTAINVLTSEGKRLFLVSPNVIQEWKNVDAEFVYVPIKDGLPIGEIILGSGFVKEDLKSRVYSYPQHGCKIKTDGMLVRDIKYPEGLGK